LEEQLGTDALPAAPGVNSFPNSRLGKHCGETRALSPFFDRHPHRLALTPATARPDPPRPPPHQVTMMSCSDNPGISTIPAKETAMIELTEEQRQEMRQANGEAPRAIDPDTKQEYVLIRAELYERMKTLFYDAGDWTP